MSLLLIITLGISTVLLTLYLPRHKKHCSSKDSQNDQKKSIIYSARDVECKIEAYDGTDPGHNIKFSSKNFKGEKELCKTL